MIRYAHSGDIPSLKYLLKKVFGNGDFFIDLLFKWKFKDNVCVYETDEKIVSMAFLLPAQLSFNGHDNPVTYLYGCATLPSYRNCGYMSAIIDTVFHDICERGEAALFLLPDQVSLYDYYAKMGFEKYFYWQKLEYVRDFFRCYDEHYEIRKISAEEYASERRRMLSGDGVVHWDLAHFQLLEAAGDDFYAVEKNHEPIAYCLIREFDAHLEVTEMIGECLPDIQELFFRSFEVDSFSICTKGTSEKSALIRFNPNCTNEYSGLGYFNIGLL